MNTAAAIEALASVESEMSKRLGVKIQMVREESSQEIAITARYHASKTVVVAEEFPQNTRQIIDSLIDGAVSAKLALCSHVQEQLMGLGDKDESREIADAAYAYRTKLAELQNAQERYSKSPDGTVLKTDARDRLIALREQAENIRHKLLSLAAGNYPTGITL